MRSLPRLLPERWIPALLLLSIGGGLLLPIAPLWYGMPMVIAVAMVWHYGNEKIAPWQRNVVMLALPLLLACIAAAHLFAAAASPFDYAHAQFMREGAAFPLPLGVALSIYMMALAALMVKLCRGNAQNTLQRGFIYAIAALVFCFQLAPLLHLAGWAAGGDSPMAEFSELFIWNGWPLIALCGFLLARSRKGIGGEILHIVTRCGTAIACVLLAQHLIGDYSYVVVGNALNEHMVRAKASYYYHAPASWLVAISLLICLSQMKQAVRPATLLSILVLAAALWFNATRAVSLGLVAGCALWLVLLLRSGQRDWRAFAAALLIALFSTQIAYEKSSSIARLVEAELKQSAENHIIKQAIQASVQGAFASSVPNQLLEGKFREAPTTENRKPLAAPDSMIRSNYLRMTLLSQGITAFTYHPLVGFGVGAIAIPLNGYMVDGSMTSKSSHSLLINIGLAAGIPAMLLMAGLMGSVLVAGAATLYRQRATPCNESATLLMCLLFWCVTIFFFPHERSFLPHLSFILLALLAAGTARGDSSAATLPTAVRPVMAVFTAGMVIFSALWSSGVTMPLVELAGWHLRNEQPGSHSTLYTNSPRIHALSRVLPGRLGGIRMLEDSFDSLPREDAWIIWDRTNDRDYPQVIAQLGYNVRHPGGIIPYFNLLPEWSVANRLQSSICILRAGTLPHRVTLPEGAAPATEYFFANLVRRADISQENGMRVSTLGDYKRTTAWLPAIEEATLIIDHKGRSHEVHAYRMVRAHQPDIVQYETLGWQLEGSNDATHWTLLDRQRPQSITADPVNAPYYLVTREGYFRYHRLRFHLPEGVQPDHDRRVAISMLELYSRKPARK